jgi:tRNA-specific 2-thiouridylase
MKNNSRTKPLKEKVLVAMSGGVDSSVAALLLREQGYEVIGATMRLWHEADDKARPGGCCSLSDVHDAKRVCDSLGIRHYVLNLEKEFKKYVVDDFVSEYLAGRTPNPCIVCNEKMKFGLLFKKMEALGLDYIATGHYACVVKSGRCFKLKKALDVKKDQSYVLYRLTQKELSKLLLPLGGITKPEIRKMAERAKLPVAHKAESQEICFVRSNYADFLSGYVPDAAKKIKPGPIVNMSGKVIGKHKGFPYYTIGQRSGLGISHPVPLYVVKIDPERNTLVAAEKDAVYSKKVLVGSLGWVNGKPKKFPFSCSVKIRYLHKEAPARLFAVGSGIRVEFKEPQMAITPGQSAVFYKKDTVLGGGIITAEKRE